MVRPTSVFLHDHGIMHKIKSDWLAHALLYNDSVTRLVPLNNDHHTDPYRSAAREAEKGGIDWRETVLFSTGIEEGDFHLLSERGLIHDVFLCDPERSEDYQSLYRKILDTFSKELERSGTRDIELPSPLECRGIHIPTEFTEQLEATLSERSIEYSRDSFPTLPQYYLLPLQVGEALRSLQQGALLSDFSLRHRSSVVIGSGEPAFESRAFTVEERIGNNPLIAIALKDFLPAPHHGTSLREILKFREDRGELLDQFRKELNEFFNDLSQSQSPEELKSVISDFCNRQQSGVKEVSRAMARRGRENRLGYYKAFLGLATSGYVGTAFGALTAASVAPAIALGVATLGLVYLKNKIEEDKLLVAAPYGYLYMAKQAAVS